MNDHLISRWLCRFAFVLCGLFVTFATGAQSNRPTFLWITCNDMDPDIGSYGDTTDENPNLDPLRARSNAALIQRCDDVFSK